jgi:hypothetical protein
MIRSKLDRAYDDRLTGGISDELWTSKSTELEAELQRVRADMERHERASHEYEATRLQILEFAQNAYSLYVAQNPREQARLVKTLLSNCSFDRGSLTPTYNSRSICSRREPKQEIGSSGWTRTSNPPVNSEARRIVGVAEPRNLVTRRH